MTEAPTGVFVCVVGPSGAGKDTLIVCARQARGGDPAFHFVRRLVTRPANPFEDHDTIGDAEFAAGIETGAFALSWRAHGLGYAVPAEVRTAIDGGSIAVCNLSRRAIGAAREAFPSVAVVLVTAPKQIIAARLLARGRETSDAVMARIEREEAMNDAVVPDHVIVNNSAPEAGGTELVHVLDEIRVARRESAPAP